jgi:hypothetical protein
MGFGAGSVSIGLVDRDPGRPKLSPKKEKKEDISSFGVLRVLWRAGGFTWSLNVIFKG